MNPNVQRITPEDIAAALAEVEQKCGPETANLLRNRLDSLEAQVRTYQADREPDPYRWHWSLDDAHPV